MSAPNVNERTYIMIKPDGVQRGLVGEIIKRFEQRGYHLSAMKMVHPTKTLLETHYQDLSSRSLFQGFITYMQSGPCKLKLINFFYLNPLTT